MQAIKFLARVKDGIIKEVWIVIQTLAEDYNQNRDHETGKYTTGKASKKESPTASNSTTQQGKPRKRLARSFTTKKDIPLKDLGYKIPSGSTLSGIKVIASGQKIRELNRLNRMYRVNGNPEDWQKVRCTANVEGSDGTTEVREVHYYYHPNHGGVEYKFPTNPRQRGVPKER